jgi:hypothetical protein
LPKVTMTALQINFPAEVLTMVSFAANALNTSRSDIIRECVRRELPSSIEKDVAEEQVRDHEFESHYLRITSAGKPVSPNSP